MWRCCTAFSNRPQWFGCVSFFVYSDPEWGVTIWPNAGPRCVAPFLKRMQFHWFLKGLERDPRNGGDPFFDRSWNSNRSNGGSPPPMSRCAAGAEGRPAVGSGSPSWDTGAACFVTPRFGPLPDQNGGHADRRQGWGVSQNLLFSNGFSTISA